jgi:hypothetical protein
MSLLNLDLSGTHRNSVACVVMLKILIRAKLSILDSKLPVLHVQLVGWPGTEKISFLKNALLNKSRTLNSKYPERFALDQS